ncbi:MAG: peroxidase, partial [Pseudomonas sp.]|nr:peroxidase [Pseudomonas sp.]
MKTCPVRPPLEPQSVCHPITSSAIFMVATLAPDAVETVRAWCAD